MNFIKYAQPCRNCSTLLSLMDMLPMWDELIMNVSTIQCLEHQVSGIINILKDSTTNLDMARPPTSLMGIDMKKWEDTHQVHRQEQDQEVMANLQVTRGSMDQNPRRRSVTASAWMGSSAAMRPRDFHPSHGKCSRCVWTDTRT